MKKTTSLFGLLVGSLIAITMAFVGLGNNVTYAQDAVCSLTAEDYLAITDKSIALATKLRVERDSNAAKTHLVELKQLMEDGCNVSLEENAQRRVSIKVEEGDSLTDIQQRKINLAREYINAVTEGNTRLSTRLMNSIEQIQEGEKSELIVKTEGTIMERTQRIKAQIETHRTEIHKEITKADLCGNEAMYRRLTTIVDSIDEIQRLQRLASSIDDLLVANPALQNSLMVTLALTNNRIAILNDRGSNPIWETPGFDNTMRPGFCLGVIATDGVTITINGTSYNTTKDTNLFVTEPVALQDRTTYDIQVVVGDEMVFENVISVNVVTGGDYKISYNTHTPEALIITEVEIVEIVGCMDETANNYDRNATVNDIRMCEYDPEPVLGCMDPEANNFNPDANVNNSKSCEYGPEPVFGCTDPAATNYDRNATDDDRSCVYGGGR